MTLSLAIVGLIGTKITAQTVRVEGAGEQGHGFLLREGGLCWLVLPRHVAKGARRVTVFSAAPVVHSPAVVETPFWEGMDLAIGQLRGALEARCTAEPALFSAPLRAATGAEVHLQRLRSSGEIERIAMQITRTDYLTLEAQTRRPGDELFKGTSGAFLFDGERPIGMIIEALSPTEGRFIRIEEIAQNLARRLTREAAPQLSGPAPATAEGGLSFEVASAGLPPLSPEQSESNLIGAGDYVFHLTRPNRIAFRRADGGAVVLSRLRITGSSAPGLSLPRAITVEVASDPGGLRSRPFAGGTMGPDGYLELSGVRGSVRWIYVTLRSAWDEAPVGLSEISFHE